MDFEYSCGWCGGDNVLEGRDVGFWGTRWVVDAVWDCFWCGEENETPDD